MEEEWPRLEEASERCDSLMKTLLTLLQVASIQSRRTPHVPHYHPNSHPDRAALFGNIEAVVPNHAHRMESLSAAEKVRDKKKTIHSENKIKIREFESMLRNKKEQLHKAAPNTDIDSRREMKLKALFMQEKYKRDKMLSIAAKRHSQTSLVAGKERGGERSSEQAGKRWGEREPTNHNSQAVMKELVKGQRLKERQRACRSQEMLLEEMKVEGGMRETKSQEMLEDRWAHEVVRKNHRLAPPVKRGGGDWALRGVAMQEPSTATHSQESQHSLPSILDQDKTRKAKLLREQQQNGGQPKSSSQPEYLQPFSSYEDENSSSLGNVGIIQPSKLVHRRRKAQEEFEEGKRMSISGEADLMKVEKYYDTLQRKKMVEKSNVLQDSRTQVGSQAKTDAPQTVGGPPHTVGGSRVPPRGSRVPPAVKPKGFAVSFSGSSFNASTSSGGGHTSSRLHPKPNPLTSSSLSSFGGDPSSYELTSSGSSVGVKISPLRSVVRTAPGYERTEDRSSIPRPQKGSLSQPTSQQEEAPVLRRAKKPQYVGIPSRYSMAEYGSHGGGSKSDVGTPSPQSASPSRVRFGLRGNTFAASSNGGGDSSEDGKKASRSSYHQIQNAKRLEFGVTLKLQEAVKRNTLVLSNSDDSFQDPKQQQQQQQQQHSDSKTTTSVVMPHQNGTVHDNSEIFENDTVLADEAQQQQQQQQQQSNGHLRAKGRAGEGNSEQRQNPKRVSENEIPHVHGIPASSLNKMAARQNPPKMEGRLAYPQGTQQQIQHQHHRQQGQGGPQAGSRFGSSGTSYSQHAPPRAHKLNPAPHPPTTSVGGGGGARAGPAGKAAARTRQAYTGTSKLTLGTTNHRVQFQPLPEAYSDVRPHPLGSKSGGSGIPMRATRSAQTPNDTHLTSYPRSHAEALQRRTMSNGKVQIYPHHHPSNNRISHAHTTGSHAHSQGNHRTKLGLQYGGGGGGGGVAGRGGYGNGIPNASNNSEMMVGSLV